MDTILFGNFTIQQLLIGVFILMGSMIAWSVLKKFFKKDKTSAHTQEVQCGCGWKGQVSVHAGRCPKCNTPLGRQMAKTYR
jgi:positive regulator of sigma E activity